MTEVAGQEHGSKADCIRKASKGKYDPGKVLMIGDAMGDFEAARSNGVLFYPIIPCREEESWLYAGSGLIGEFVSGRYAGAAMDRILKKFDEALLDTPPWEQQ